MQHARPARARAPDASTAGTLTSSHGTAPVRLARPAQSGYNAAVLFNLMFILLSLIPLPCIFTVAYGKLDDPSPAEVRAAKSMM